MISRPIDVEEGFSAPITLTQTSPLVYYYGSLSPLEKPRLYDTLVTKLATVVKKKLEGAMAKAAGIIVDTPAEFVTPEGFKQISHVVEEFGITSILVIGQERLFSDLERNYKENLLITIIGISKSGGVISL